MQTVNLRSLARFCCSAVRFGTNKTNQAKSAYTFFIFTKINYPKVYCIWTETNLNNRWLVLCPALLIYRFKDHAYLNPFCFLPWTFVLHSWKPFHWTSASHALHTDGPVSCITGGSSWPLRETLPASALMTGGNGCYHEMARHLRSLPSAVSMVSETLFFFFFLRVILLFFCTLHTSCGLILYVLNRFFLCYWWI